jgi:uncharacterized UPF0160 family protein
MKIITHDNRFHADDVCAMATLRIQFGDQITEVIRTRDESIIKTGDIVFDVGHICDSDANRFDHHQTEGAGKRDNGIPYASFGLVWKKWGEEICGSKEAAHLVDKKFVQMIDASDNGFLTYQYIQEDLREYVFDSICHSFGSTWKEEENYDEIFFEMVDIAEKILRREIKVAKDKSEAVPLIEKVYQEAPDKSVIVFDQYYPWGDTLKKYPDIYFVISPDKEKKQWRINTIQDKQLQNKKSLPASWSGLKGEELEKETGVVGAVFCHRALFLAVSNSKESAILLAKKALEA